MKGSIIIATVLLLCGCRTSQAIKKADIISAEFAGLSMFKIYTDIDAIGFVDSCLQVIDALDKATMFDNQSYKSGRTSIGSPNYVSIIQKLDQRVLSLQSGLSIDYLLGVDNQGNVRVVLVKELPKVRYFDESDLKMITYHLFKDQRYQADVNASCLDFAVYNFSINR